MTCPRIVLLTHEQELAKKTNTGRLVLDVLGSSATRIIWRRTTPEPELLRRIDTGGVALVWPLAGGRTLTPTSVPETYVVIDGTWKQAQRIYNRSPYLHALPKISLRPAQPSIYTLRRNQIEGGLCTAEAVACLLRQPEHATSGGAVLADSILSCLHALMTARRRPAFTSPSSPGSTPGC